MPQTSPAAPPKRGAAAPIRAGPPLISYHGDTTHHTPPTYRT